MHTDHEKFMFRCLELAARSRGFVAPNPMVGALLVRHGQIIGEGHHEKYGGPHAEVNAVQSVKNRAELKDASLYVTLEPCCHFGKTPPCTDLILESKIPHVVVGCTDANEKVDGKGLGLLRAQGVKVELGTLAESCLDLNKRFFTFHRSKRPYVILKWAQTSDGYIARTDMSSKWISSEDSRALVHQWRSEESGIMVGTTTARIDNPYLTARVPGARNPTRIVIDKELKLPNTLHVFNADAPKIIFNAKEDRAPSHFKIDFSQNVLPQVLERLYQQKVLSLIIEGGSTLLSACIEANLWDEARVFVSPEKFGAGLAAPRLEATSIQEETIGPDTLFWYENAHWPQLRKELRELNYDACTQR